MSTYADRIPRAPADWGQDSIDEYREAQAEARVTEQRFEALAIANRYRSAVAREREEIASLLRPEAVERLAELIETATDPALLSGRILHYLGAIPYRGVYYANRAISAAGITDPRARIRDLDENERAALAVQVRRLA